MNEPVTSGREVILLRETTCPLCEDVRDALLEMRDDLQFRLREVDVSSDPSLYRRYQYVVPVVCANGLTLLSGRIAPDDMRTEIERAFGPNPLAETPEDEEEFLRLLECPICEGDLESRPRAVACLRCGKEYERRDGVLLLLDPPEPPSRLRLMARLARIISFKLERPKKRG